MNRDERNLAGTNCIFNTCGTDSVLKAYDGMPCFVFKRLSEDSYDFNDVGSMWIVRLENGMEIEAFADELETI